MKAFILITGILFASFTVYGLKTDTLGTAGDDLDLYAVMELFKDSESVEDFENKLNSEKNEVNNLDINQDGHVDYIRVIDYADANSHSLTLQVPFSESEAQDIAVIEIEQTDDETAIVQIVGDEDLYGEDYIVEPNSGEDSFKDNGTEVVNVYKWRPVRYIYAPSYVVWVSPWRYNYYPRWYRPWRPVVWSVYFGRVHRHHVHYRRVRFHRCHHAHNHYYKHRRHSHTFHVHHKSHHNKHHHKGHGIKTGGKKSVKGNGVNGKKSVHSKKTKMNSPTPKSNAGKPTKRPGGTVKKSGGKKSKGGKH